MIVFDSCVNCSGRGPNCVRKTLREISEILQILMASSRRAKYAAGPYESNYYPLEIGRRSSLIRVIVFMAEGFRGIR